MSNDEPGLAPEKRQAAPVQHNPFNSGEWLARLGIAGALVGSLALIWWSLTQVLAPAQKQSRESAAAVARLSSEVDDLQRRWTPERTREINEKFTQIGAHLFGTQAGLEGWLADLKEQADPLKLEVKTDFGQPLPQVVDKKLALIPATLTITEAPGGAASPYRGILQLAQHLAARPERTDLVEMTLTGGAKNINSAVLVLNLWAGEGLQR